MRFKKVLCMTTLATLLFPAVQNIEYVDAAEYSVDIIVDTVEIDINDIPEDRCVKVGISLRNNPGMDGIFFPLEKDSRIQYLGTPPIEYSDMSLSITDLTANISEFSLFYGDIGKLIEGDDYFCYIKFQLPENILVGDFYAINILNEYIYNSNETSDGVMFNLRFLDKDLNYCTSDCFNITNGGIHIVGAELPQTEPPQTEPPQTEPPQTEPPQTEPPQTEPPQTSTSSDTSTTIESTTITTTSITTTTNELTVTTTGNTTISTTSVTTTSSASSVTTTTTPETSEVTENKNDKSKNNLPLILAILTSIGILGGIIGFIIKKSKGNKGK